jgi:hypothetical protein
LKWARAPKAQRYVPASHRGLTAPVEARRNPVGWARPWRSAAATSGRSSSSHRGSSGGTFASASEKRSEGGKSPICRAKASITSCADVQSVAPSRMSSFVPSARGSSGEPGTAKTSRPCSAAKRAVIKDPERRAASTITLPCARPAMIRLRRGKSLPAPPSRTAFH